MASDENSVPERLMLMSTEEFLPSIRPWAQWGGWVLIAGFLTGMILLATLQYSVIIDAPVSIRPAGELHLAQAASRGTVKRIEVGENSKVRKGDVIAYLEDSDLQTRRRHSQNDLDLLQRQKTQVAAQIAALEKQIAAEKEQFNRALISTLAEIDFNERRHRDLQLTTGAEMREAQAEYDVTKDEVDRYHSLLEDGVVSELQVKQKEAALAVIGSKLDQARISLDPSDAEIKMLREKYAEKNAEGRVAMAKSKNMLEQLIAQKIEVASKIAGVGNSLQQIERDLRKKIIRTPSDGIIQSLNLHNIGQVVDAGETLAVIAPAAAKLRVKAQVAPEDVAEIAIGQLTHVRISACPYPDYGTLAGVVEKISPDVENFQNGKQSGMMQNGRSGELFYMVTIVPKQLILDAYGRRCSVQLGMQGLAEIVTRRETALQFLLRKAKLSISY